MTLLFAALLILGSARFAVAAPTASSPDASPALGIAASSLDASPALGIVASSPDDSLALGIAASSPDDSPAAGREEAIKEDTKEPIEDGRGAKEATGDEGKGKKDGARDNGRRRVIALDPKRAVIADSSKVKKGKLPMHVAVYKNEKMVGAAFMYANMNSNNSEFLLLANAIDAQGQCYRISPFVSWAYRDNCSIGARFAYTRMLGEISEGSLGLLSDDLKFDLTDANVDYHIYKAALFHRNYMGLDRRGTIGLFLEFQLSYKYSRSVFGKNPDTYSDGHSVSLGLSPGVVLYILPMVSIEASLGIANVGYSHSSTYSSGQRQGLRDKWNAGVDLNLLNLNFGISYHF